MIIELGHFALILALAVALVQMLLPAWGAHVGDARLMAVAPPAALAQLTLLTFSFLSLTHAFITSDFSVETVWANSHTRQAADLQILRRLGKPRRLDAAVGADPRRSSAPPSPCLVATCPTSCAPMSWPCRRQSPSPFWFLSSLPPVPSARIPPQAEGRGLNPILQDPALAFHPPFLYAGYVGLSMAFSFAIAALIEGRTDAAWARWVRPWTLAAWMSLTLGIAMGSWWAYYELGWGGWWFWDPVENASFMPWLAATALLHSALVMEKREALKVWTILLAILAFSLSLIGTFLVRSGILTSVHAFAVDPRRGVFILAILTLLIGGALALYAWRAPQLRQGGLFAPISREGGLVLNNVLLTTACATVFIGTLYPLALEAVTGAKISVGAPYFNLTFGPLMVPLLLAMPLGPLLAWKRGDLLGAVQRLAAAIALSLLAVVFTLALQWRGPWLAPFGIAVGAWVIAGAAVRMGDTREVVYGGARRDLSSRLWSAAVGIRGHAGTRRHWGDRRRHRCHLRLAGRTRRGPAAGRARVHRRLRTDLSRCRPKAGSKLPGGGRSAGGIARRRACHRTDARRSGPSTCHSRRPRKPASTLAGGATFTSCSATSSLRAVGSCACSSIRSCA